MDTITTIVALLSVEKIRDFSPSPLFANNFLMIVVADTLRTVAPNAIWKAL